ncbi:aspartate--tRNA ligase [Malassezia sp. CBS 17886]|nr:aspartate--tRNA ligase [Malassezia sp. CBS 17886]
MGVKVSRQLAFVPLQDATGTVQLKLVADDSAGAARLQDVCSVPVESVLSVRGTVRARAPGAANPDMATGDVEVVVHDWQLLNAADPSLPFLATQCRHGALPKASLRAQHRYLDLRRRDLAENLRTRSRVAHAARSYLHANRFVELETPVLLRSSPEGAREFLVPTRAASGQGTPQFYALQQSPQQPKQLLMVSGMTDRYFQFARCFRDEDGRRDRQPEFTQLDMEMSFVSGAGRGGTDPWRIGGQEVRDAVQDVVRAMWEAAGAAPPLPDGVFPVYTYADVMNTYGSDKPDLRYELKIHNLAPSLGAPPSVALDVLVCPQYVTRQNRTLKLSARQLDALLVRKDGQMSQVEHFKAVRGAAEDAAAVILQKSRHVAGATGVPMGAPAAAAQQRGAAPAHSDAARAAFGAALQDAMDGAQIARHPELERAPRCDVFVARRELPVHGGSTELGDLRTKLAAAYHEMHAGLVDAAPAVLWVTEFPLFTRSDAEKNAAAGDRWSSSHHPFTAPVADDVGRLTAAGVGDAALATIRGQHYDLVLNGNEIGGGSVRIHDPQLQEHVLRRVLALSGEECASFAHLLHALRSGAPPHAGIALGFDRLMAILCNTPSIRDVIAFPKSSAGVDPLLGAPAALEDGGRDVTDERLAPYLLHRTTRGAADP